MRKGFGPTTKKVLMLLAAGVALGFARSPKQYFRVVKEIRHEWEKINRKKLNEAIKSLYRNKLVDIKEYSDGRVAIKVNDLGKKKVFSYKLDEIKISRPAQWDGNWRIVVFDIPEKHKNAREALRAKLKELGFHRLQKSIFVLPYECKNEIDFIVEIFQIRPYVRYILAKYIDNELHLKKLFNLI